MSKIYLNGHEELFHAVSKLATFARAVKQIGNLRWHCLDIKVIFQ